VKRVMVMVSIRVRDRTPMFAIMPLKLHVCRNTVYAVKKISKSYG